MNGRPLSGQRVLVPRAPRQAEQLAERVRALGGEPVQAPTLAIHPGDREGLAAALRDLAAGRFVAVCFTSPNGVAAVAEVLEDLGLGRDALAVVTVAAIGSGTASALRTQLGVSPEVVPDRSTTAALGAAFPPGRGRVLLPRADIATPTLPAALRQRGYEPVEVDAYVTAQPGDLPDGVADALAGGAIDLVPFTSSSTVRNLVALLGARPLRGRVVSIGPVTSATCREHGIEVAVEAVRHDLDGLVEALVRAARAD